MMRKVAEEEATPGLRFKVVEKGGKRLESLLSKPNLTASASLCQKKISQEKNVLVVINLVELIIAKSQMYYTGMNV